jgi:hypothetical protein
VVFDVLSGLLSLTYELAVVLNKSQYDRCDPFGLNGLRSLIYQDGVAD